MFFRSLVVASIVSLVAAGPCTRTYVVQDGDICDSISAAQNVSTYQLATINRGIINDGCTNLMPGQAICLGYEGEDCDMVHVVAGGDTCDAISAAHSINTTLLYENNGQINPECTNIYIGEVLCVAGTVAVPPPAGGGSSTSYPPVPSTATPANPTKTPEPDAEDDDREEDLPWCDEL